MQPPNRIVSAYVVPLQSPESSGRFQILHQVSTNHFSSKPIRSPVYRSIEAEVELGTYLIS